MDALARSCKAGNPALEFQAIRASLVQVQHGGSHKGTWAHESVLALTGLRRVDGRLDLGGVVESTSTKVMSRDAGKSDVHFSNFRAEPKQAEAPVDIPEPKMARTM